MKVRFLISAYRDRYGADHVKGDEWEYPDHVADKLVRLGYAEIVAEPKPKPEPVATATIETVEAAVPKTTTAKRTGKAKPRSKP